MNSQSVLSGSGLEGEPEPELQPELEPEVGTKENGIGAAGER